jgi:coenzyme Q-binding protein COQ10
MTIGTSLLRRNFSTVAHLDRPHRINIISRDPSFERFEQRWTFEPASDGGSIVEYRLDLKFRSRLFQTLIGGSLADRAPAIVAALRRRAQQLYPATSEKRQT